MNSLALAALLVCLLPTAPLLGAQSLSLPRGEAPHAGPSQKQKKKRKADKSERKRKDPPFLEEHPDPEQKPDQQGAPFKFGVEVNLVVLTTSVVDQEGNFVGGLKKEDFTIYEDQVAQTILSFGQLDMPISLGLVIDTSGSMRSKIALVNQAAMKFLESSNLEDETFLVAFDDEVSLVEDFTDDLDTIRDELDNLIVSGGTALYDAIYLATKKAQAGTHQKHALLVISDGEDRDSYYKLEEVLRIIQEADVQIYVIGLLTPEQEEGIFDIFKKKPQERAKEALTRIARETGGKAIFPKGITELSDIVKEIAHELRNQYHIGYVPTNKAKDGAWRAVRIVLSNSKPKKLRVRARSGYFAPAAPASPPKH